MNEKAITLSIFFFSVFLLYQIRFIVRLRKLRKIKGIETGKGHFMEGVGLIDCNCCCDDVLDICGIPLRICFEIYKQDKEEKTADQIEQKTAERHLREQEEHYIRQELEQIEGKEKVEKLRASGFKVSSRNKNKIIETANLSSETNLSWLSKSTRIPIEEIIIIIEDAPDFEIREEYIINKKKIKEIEKTCINCRNPIEHDSEFCPNCGLNL